MVTSLNGPVDHGKKEGIEIPNYSAPASPAGEGFDEHFEKLETSLDTNQKNLADITKQVAQSLHERKRLLLVGEEMHALISLHKAAKMLHENEAQITEVEDEIKKLGEEAEELIRERTELKRQLEEELKDKDTQLEGTRAKLSELAKQLDELHENHHHSVHLVSAWQARAKAIREAREKHEQMDAMEHLVGIPPASDEVDFPAGHVVDPETKIPDMTASDTDIADLEQAINDFAARHVHQGGEAAAAPAPPAADEAAPAAPAGEAVFRAKSLMRHNTAARKH
jgi:uncharacterized protein YoxC